MCQERNEHRCGPNGWLAPGNWDECSNCVADYVSSKSRHVSNDQVNHPTHYTSHPSGIEVIQITEHMPFCTGNAIKYILRAPYKGKELQDLEKAIWYLKREIERLKKLKEGTK